MNDARRKMLRRAVSLLQDAKGLLEEAKSLVEDAKGEEEEYRDNMPENMQQSERYERADAVVDKLQEVEAALDFDVDDLVSSLEEAAE